MGEKTTTMKLQANTLILLAIALSFGLGLYWLEQRQSSQESVEELASGTPIFNFKEDEVQAFTLKTEQYSLSFERTQRSFPNTWAMQTPEKVSADEAAVAYLLNLLATSRSQQTLEIGRDRRREFGLDQPLATVEVTLKDKKRHQLILGQFNFNQSAIYALADPPTPEPAKLSVLLVPTAFESAINRPLAEWKYNPQAPQTPLPSPDPN